MNINRPVLGTAGVTACGLGITALTYVAGGVNAAIVAAAGTAVMTRVTAVGALRNIPQAHVQTRNRYDQMRFDFK